ncbi:unnamed protein product [Arctogadus glacialis]
MEVDRWTYVGYRERTRAVRGELDSLLLSELELMWTSATRSNHLEAVSEPAVGGRPVVTKENRVSLWYVGSPQQAALL